MSNKGKIEITVMELKIFKLNVRDVEGHDNYYFIEDNLFIKGVDDIQKANSKDQKSSWFKAFLNKYNLKSKNSPTIVFKKGENNQ